MSSRGYMVASRRAIRDDSSNKEGDVHYKQSQERQPKLVKNGWDGSSTQREFFSNKGDAQLAVHKNTHHPSTPLQVSKKPRQIECEEGEIQQTVQGHQKRGSVLGRSSFLPQLSGKMGAGISIPRQTTPQIYMESQFPGSQRSGTTYEEGHVRIEVSRGGTTQRHLQLNAENLNLMFYDFNQSSLRPPTRTREQDRVGEEGQRCQELSSTGFKQHVPADKTATVVKTRGSFFQASNATRDAQLSSRCGSRQGRAAQPLASAEEGLGRRRPLTKGRFQEAREYFAEMGRDRGEKKESAMKDVLNLYGSPNQLAAQRLGVIKAEEECFPSKVKPSMVKSKTPQLELETHDSSSREVKRRHTKMEGRFLGDQIQEISEEEIQTFHMHSGEEGCRE